MKKVMPLSILTVGFIFLLSFKTIESKESNIPLVIKIPVNSNTIQPGEWGTWSTTSCYKGLDFRVKNKGKNYDNTKYKWGVQFRNRYRDKIYFNYEVYDNRPSNPSTTNRTDLDPDEINSGYRDFYMNNGNSIYVYVDKVRFGRDGLQDYYNCDY